MKSDGYFRKGWKAWKKELKEHKYKIIISLVLIFIAGFLHYYSGVYVTNVEGNTVPDLILDHVGPYNLSFMYSYGYLFLISLLIIYPLIFRISKLSKTISYFALIVIIRSFFLIFTHLQSPLDAIPVSFPSIINYLAFSNDMFFSGHVAIPLIGFFVFKDSLIKYVFLIGSIIMGAVVLLMHLHYSIDVFAAFFIVYASIHILENIQKRLSNK